jgi:hypothetical protein
MRKKIDNKILEQIKEGIKEYGDIQTYAEKLGWDKKSALRVRQTDPGIAANGTRREGRIKNSYIP